MIFNHCIYGTINKTEGTLTATYYPNKLDSAVSKDYILTDSNYQFNLGDSDLLGVQSNIYENDIVLIEYRDLLGNKSFSDYLKLDIVGLQECNINVTSCTETPDEANFIQTENVIKTTSNYIIENSTDMYSYFEISNTDENKILYKSNDNSLKFSPVTSNKYRIFQRAVNKTSNAVTEKDYIFNAIVSSATITRSNKCKGINDSIKILFMGNDATSANITVIKDDTVLEMGAMAIEGNNLYSYNYVFPSVGYYCFRVDYKDETFLVNFKVQQADFKIYYSDEHHREGLSLDYNMYYINDVSTVIGTGALNSIQDGLYSSDLLSVDYGDYMFEIQDEYHISSFEECAEAGSGDDSSTAKDEEIFWIFPNNIGD